MATATHSSSIRGQQEPNPIKVVERALLQAKNSIEKNEPGKAMVCFNIALRYGVDSRDALSLMRLLAPKVAEHRVAISGFLKLISASSIVQDSDCASFVARLNNSLGNRCAEFDDELAAQHYEAALQMVPGMASAKDRLADIQTRMFYERHSV